MKTRIYVGLAVLSGWLQQGRGADALDSWTAYNPGTSNGIYSLAFGGGTFVGVGLNGGVATSKDGAHWEQQKSGALDPLFGIAYGGNQFVAVGGQGVGKSPATIITSPDGVNWTLRRDPADSASLNAVTYGAGKYVAVGYIKGASITYGRIIYSDDGIQWTTVNNTNTPSFTSVCYGNGRFMALYGGDTQGSSIGISENGVDWNFVRSGPDAASQICYGNGQFVAVGYYTRRIPPARGFSPYAVIYSSANGLNWVKRQDVPYYAYEGVGFGGSVFVAVGGPSSESLGAVITSTSTDGINWTQRPVSNGGYRVGYGNNQIIISRGDVVFVSGAIGRMGASLSPGGEFQGRMSGITGQSYLVEASTDFRTWNAFTNAIVADGTAEFSSPASAGTRQYFRASIKTQ